MEQFAPYMLIALTLGCGFGMGYIRGYAASFKEVSGWESEALWWRSHATGIDKEPQRDEEP